MEKQFYAEILLTQFENNFVDPADYQNKSPTTKSRGDIV